MLKRLRDYLDECDNAPKGSRKHIIGAIVEISLFSTILFGGVYLYEYASKHQDIQRLIFLGVIAFIAIRFKEKIIAIVKHFIDKFNAANRFADEASSEEVAKLTHKVKLGVIIAGAALIIGSAIAFIPLGIIMFALCGMYYEKLEKYLNDEVVARALVKHVMFNIKVAPVLLLLVLFVAEDSRDAFRVYFIGWVLFFIINTIYLYLNRETKIHKLWGVLITFGIAAIWIFGKSGSDIDDGDSLDSSDMADSSVLGDSDYVAADGGMSIDMNDTPIPSDSASGFAGMESSSDMGPNWNNDSDISMTTAAVNVPLDNIDTPLASDSGVTVSSFDGKDSITLQDNKIIDETNMQVGTYGTDVSNGNIAFRDNAGNNLGSIDPNTGITYDASGKADGSVNDLGAVTTYTDADGNQAMKINLDGASVVDSKTGEPIATVKKN